MKIIVPATSANLGPGFDCLGLSLALFNEIEIKKSSCHMISIKGEGKDNLKIKKRNYFVSIFNDIYKNLTGETDSFKFSFNNHIPFSRGLGSSSAVIVGAIASAYQMAGFEIKKEMILNEALIYESHPDNISPATFGGFTASIVEDGKVFIQKAEISDEIKAVVVIPNIPMSTNRLREVLPKNYPLKDIVFNLSHASFLSSCFFSKEYDKLKYGAKDMLHENLRMKNLPNLFKVREIALENGALLSTLSGSGSSFLNIVYKDDAIKLKKILENSFKNFKISVFDFDNGGFKVIES